MARFRRLSRERGATMHNDFVDREDEASVTETAEPTAPAQSWRLDADTGRTSPRRRSMCSSTSTTRSPGRVGKYQPVPLGFTPLDKTIGTGWRAGELLLIGGAQGTGKTTMALQMARTSRRAARRTSSTSASSTTSSTCSIA